MKKKNILVLATFDERGRGHGWSQYLRFKELGHNVQFLCLLRTQADTPKDCCIIDSFSKYSWRYLWYKLWKILEKIMFAPYPSMRAMYKGVDFASSNDILKRLQHKPDLIVVCTYQFFLSPHSLYNIYYINYCFILSCIYVVQNFINLLISHKNIEFFLIYIYNFFHKGKVLLLE